MLPSVSSLDVARTATSSLDVFLFRRAVMLFWYRGVAESLIGVSLLSIVLTWPIIFTRRLLCIEAIAEQVSTTTGLWWQRNFDLELRRTSGSSIMIVIDWILFSENNSAGVGSTSLAVQPGSCQDRLVVLMEWLCTGIWCVLSNEDPVVRALQYPYQLLSCMISILTL